MRRTIDYLLACSPDSQARIKQLIPRIAQLEFADAAPHTIESITAARATEGGKAGMAAFLDKSRPPWAGDDE